MREVRTTHDYLTGLFTADWMSSGLTRHSSA